LGTKLFCEVAYFFVDKLFFEEILFLVV